MNCYSRTALFAAILLIAGPMFGQSSSSTLPEAPAVSPSQSSQQQAAPDQTAPDQSAPGDASGQAGSGQPGSGQAAAPAHPEPQPTGPTVLFNTSMGRITCKLFSKEAPITVANFVGLATGTKDWTNPSTHETMHNKPLYNGTIFHRVIPGFMIQGGDPLGTGMGGPGYEFKNEQDPNLNFDVAGRLAMANSGPDTNGSQFFITEAPADYLNQKYTIFGQCDDPSVWVVKSIAMVNRDQNDRPIDPVTLNSVTVIPAGQPVPPAMPEAPAPAPAASGAGTPQ